ncbi:tRNA guanosine(34) transglycosylase Tgt [Candidatus Parcubacteria bacterium]|nr:MAG: tRNA guanosine(34) transglycosylase Tgt [Candidatus Parcubacteria bacterium]
MIRFRILKQSKKTRARIGILETPHGEVETPTLVPVATQANVKTLSSDEIRHTRSQILIVNTFHLHLRPGEKIVKRAGGLHDFMHWQRPLMTDSGGYQVFSLGFGKDFGMGKMLRKKSDVSVKHGQQPKLLNIQEDGVLFTSYLDGKKIFLGPKESMKIQEALGADIIFAFDECTSPVADKAYTKASLLRTHRWAKESLKHRTSNQALFGIIQGGKFRDLRVESARIIRNMPFDGFGIGGEFGDEKGLMAKMLGWVLKELPEEKPRHLLGIGHVEDIKPIIRAGVDLFDCIVPTHYARHNIAFTSEGRIDLMKSRHLKEHKALDPECGCFVCENHTRSYLAHLARAREITGMKLLTFHNLCFFNAYVERLREEIRKGKL